MRIATLVTLPLLGALIVLPARAPAQATISVGLGTRLGPETSVFAYAPDRQGDWRATYRQWTPVTLYDINGHYYRNSVRGARAVLVYQLNNETFLPPQDSAWVGSDERYNYQQQPTPADYDRVRPYTPDAVVRDPRLGEEIGVLGYSIERAGDWRDNFRSWAPATVYEVNGRYYLRNSPGARRVAIYRYHDEYFLPPQDQAWLGADKRFHYDQKPNNDDYGRVRQQP